MDWQPISTAPRGEPIMILTRFEDQFDIIVDTLSDGTVEWWERVSEKRQEQRTVPATFTSDGEELIGDWWAPWNDPGEVDVEHSYQPSYSRMRL